jgi:glutamate-5-semialdehyde dehydrogenase
VVTLDLSTSHDLLAAASAARAQAPAPGDARYAAYCTELARGLGNCWDAVLAANAQDLDNARARGLSETLLDRLRLTERHLAPLVKLAERTRAALPEVTKPSEAVPAFGEMTVRRMPKPLGVLLMIYEARPTVTVEAALLPVAVGNVVLLRGGSEVAASNAKLGEIAAEAAAAAGLPDGMVHVLIDNDRRLIRELLKRHDAIDAVIPRGSPSLIDYCRTASQIPVIASGGGVNHLYVDASADVRLAARVALDSKLTEPTACNTLEMVLAHQDIARDLVDELLPHDFDLRLDPALMRAGATPLTPHDDGREFLDRTFGVRPVTGLEQAVAHIRRHGSQHTEGIIAADPAVLQRYLDAVDAAALVVNGSLRLHDGQTMGLGPEISISTGRLHTRGPVDLGALLTYSWVIEGRGTLRGEHKEIAP